MVTCQIFVTFLLWCLIYCLMECYGVSWFLMVSFTSYRYVLYRKWFLKCIRGVYTAALENQKSVWSASVNQAIVSYVGLSSVWTGEANHSRRGLTNLTDLSYDLTFQLLWTTWCIARKWSCMYCLFQPLLLYLSWLCLVVVWACVFYVWVWVIQNLSVGLLWSWFCVCTFVSGNECSAVQWSPGNIIFTSCQRRSCLNRFSWCSTI